MAKLKDTDYLYISTSLRYKETQLLSREKMERILDARSDEEAVKVLSDCGYDGLDPLTEKALDASLARARTATFTELASLSPNSEIVDAFRLKYDYHNLKTLIKCAAASVSPDGILIDAGRVSTSELQDAILREDFSRLPNALSAAYAQARDALSSTGDPQRCDFLLDRAYFAELSSTAEASGSEFLQGYVRLLIDAANLKALVRTLRMKKSREFFTAAAVPGGNVDLTALLAAFAAGGSLEITFTGALKDAAALGSGILQGGSQTAFEKACDNACNAYLQSSYLKPFGDSVLVSYIAARENEITAARILIKGRLRGLPADAIRERLRDSYV